MNACSHGVNKPRRSRFKRGHFSALVFGVVNCSGSLEYQMFDLLYKYTNAPSPARACTGRDASLSR